MDWEWLTESAKLAAVWVIACVAFAFVAEWAINGKPKL
jgi:hypothetical protein